MPGRVRLNWKSYVLAAALVLAAASVRLGLGLIEERVLYFAAFYPAILFAALHGGAGPGALAVALSLGVACYAILPPELSFAITDRATIINTSLFVLSSGLIVWIAHRYRVATAKILRGEEMRRLLVREMQHRSRNTLTVTKSVIERTLNDDPKRAKTLYERIRVLLNTDDLFEDSLSNGEFLHHIVLSELQPHGPEKFTVSGDPTMLPARHSRSLALILHELTMNAVKYGALATSSGFITVSWARQGDMVSINWHEAGTAVAVEPQSGGGGFGSQLIDIVARQLDATVKRHRSDGTYECIIFVPLDRLTPAKGESVPDLSP